MSPKPVHFPKKGPRRSPTKVFTSNYSVKNIFSSLEEGSFQRAFYYALLQILGFYRSLSQKITLDNFTTFTTRREQFTLKNLLKIKTILERQGMRSVWIKNALFSNFTEIWTWNSRKMHVNLNFSKKRGAVFSVKQMLP